VARRAGFSGWDAPVRNDGVVVVVVVVVVVLVVVVVVVVSLSHRK
jgi:hypothetical protein